MFSGLVKGTGEIVAVEDHGKDRRIVVSFADGVLPTLAVGGSVAVSGVCLTAVTAERGRFAADVSSETMAVTTFGTLGVGSRVNLEPPLRLADPLDGHLVTGHVDGVGEVRAVEPAGQSRKLRIEVPAALARYVAAKGSIAIDGVSLTVNRVEGAELEVNIIPHTQALTVIGGHGVGTRVNVEVDLVARYLERLVSVS